MKKLNNFLLFLIASTASAQVGINTETPKVTLEVKADEEDLTKADGIIAPQLTGNQIKAKDKLYTNELAGTIVYATEAVTIPSYKTSTINSPGYYYFDGDKWMKFNSNSGNELSIYTHDSNFTSNRNANLNGYNLGFTGNGNFGIGTLAPTGKLEITQNNNSSIRLNPNTTSDLDFIRNNQGTSNMSNLGVIGKINFLGRINNTNDNSLSSISALYRGNGNTLKSELRFFVSGTTAPNMTLNPDGFLGIGTINPAASIHTTGNMILGTATSTNGASGFSTVVRDNTTGELKVASSSTGNNIPLNYLVYELNNVNGDWVSNFNTKISDSQYTVAIIGSTFESSSGLSSEGHHGANSFVAQNVYAFKQGGTWRLSADFKNAAPIDASDNGTWKLYCLVINNTIVKDAGIVTANLGTNSSGAAIAPPGGL